MGGSIRWRETTLGHVARWGSGGTPNTKDSSLYGGDIPWAVIGDLTEGFVHRTAATITESGLANSSAKLVPERAVLVAMYGASIGRVGITAREMATNQAIAHALPSESVIAKYLMYYLMSQREHLVRAGKGAAQPNIGQGVLKAWPIRLPDSLDEQQRIVDLLEDHLSRLDAADTYLATAKRRLESMVSSVLLTLIPDEPDYPETWRRATVAEAGDVGLGRQRHPDWHNGPNMKPYLRVANVFENRIDTSDVMEMHWPDETFERFKLHPGDVLLNKGQSPDLLGRPAIYRGEPPETAFTNSLIRFKANDDVLPEFALLVFRRHMRSGRFKRESRITTNIAHLSAARLKPVEFPIPPIDEQTRIVAAADEQLSAVKRLALELVAAKARQKNLRRSVLSAAFSGRLTGQADLSDVAEMIPA